MKEEIGRPLKILYINHYGIFGGSQRSILELIGGFPENAISPFFITPSGNGEMLFKQMNIPYTIVPGGLSKFDHTRMGHYKGFRWLILVREFFYAFPTMVTFWKFRKRVYDFDIVHLNEITCILPLILAKKWFKKPVVLHARAVFHNDQSNLLTKHIIRILDRNTDWIVPIDETVASSIPIGNKMKVVHNSFSFNGGLMKTDTILATQLSALPRRRLNLGFIGAIHINKGIVELLQAMKMCRDNGLDVSLIIAGNGNSQNRTFLNTGMNLLGLNQDRNKMLVDFIAENRMNDYIHPLGFSTSTNDFFQYIDVICFPSYYNALGRPVFEAAFFRKPSIVALREWFADTFIEGQTGFKVEERSSRSIYEGIRKYYERPEILIEMGEKAYKLADANFNNKKNALEMLDIYKSLVVVQST